MRTRPDLRKLPEIYRPLIAILGAFVVLSVVYAWATPPFEASDELWHMGAVQHIAETGRLPVQNVADPDAPTIYEQEGSQPPLYYLVSAALVSLIDRSDFEQVTQPNPHVIAGVPGAFGNKNLVLHPPASSTLSGTILAVYVLRAFSIVLACVTISAVYLIGLEVGNVRLRVRVAALAAGITAFNPMFVFISASVNNDNLVIALNSLVIWQTLVMLRRGFQWRRSVVIGVLVALASLSKLSGLVLVPFVGLAALLVAYPTRNWRRVAGLAMIGLGCWLILASWWYLRNVQLYDELFGTATMVAVAGARDEPFTFLTLANEYQGFRFSYWALFGAVNIMTFRLFYDIMDAFTLFTLLGLGMSAYHLQFNRRQLTQIALLSVVIVTGFVSVTAWTAQTYASQGRLLFPFIAAISVVMALPLVEFLSLLPVPFMGRTREPEPVEKAGAVASFMPALLLGVFALVVPFASIAPGYQPPAPMLEVPQAANPVYAEFDGVALVSYDVPDRRYTPGDDVPLTVYWRVLQPSDRNLSLYLNAVNGDGDVIGKVDSFPASGRLQTTTWQPNTVYADSYVLPLDEDAAGRSLLRVQVGWWHYATEDNIPAVDENDNPLDSVMLNVGGFVSDIPPDLPNGLFTIEPVVFGDVIALVGYVLDDDTLALVWEAVGQPDADYTVFAQMVGDEGLVAQGDAPPSLPTRYWMPEETFVTHHTLTYNRRLQGGDYRVLVGWYKPDDFSRLSVDASDDAYPVTELLIPAPEPLPTPRPIRPIR